MPQGAAPRALLGVFVLIVALAVAIVPVVDARPKDKKDGKQDSVASETVPAQDDGQSGVDVAVDAGTDGERQGRDEPATDEPAPPVEQPLTTESGGSSDERTLLALDADGDYLPDALDNCPNIQNPDQGDADGDGHGDACPVYQDTDGDTVPDKTDNCPGVATSDFGDNDGDGVGNPCDKSPDGIEPEPEPVPELDGRGGEGEAEAPPPENGDNQDGVEVEREGRERSRERERTDREKATVTMGDDTGEGGEGVSDEPVEEVYEEPVRDNPRRNEELLAEAAAAGEIYDPAPPPEPQREWEEPTALTTWEPVMRIDAGATDDADAETQAAQEAERGEKENRGGRGGNDADNSQDASDNSLARGWVRAKLLLQEELEGPEPGDGNTEPAEEAGDDGAEENDVEDRSSDPGQALAPVPVENGLVITGNGKDEESKADPGQEEDRKADVEPSQSETRPVDEAEPSKEGDDEALDADLPQADNDHVIAGDSRQVDAGERRQPDKDDSRRNGSSRGAAATAPDRQRGTTDDGAGTDTDAEHQDTRRENRTNREADTSGSWSDDRYYDSGSALNWSGEIVIAGTDDDDLYLTQRSGSGPGKRRGFAYAIPVDESGAYMVRLYFAEPYWGAPSGPEGEEGRRLFTVAAEGEAVFTDLDVFAEAGPLTALVKQVEVVVEDGELNLQFIASEGEPIVAAIEVLASAQ